MTYDIWEDNSSLKEYDIEIPAWVSDDIEPYDIAAICQGGCASGAYMPAVTYNWAIATMGEHGDDVLQFIQDCCGELPPIKPDESWGGIAVLYLSAAVELWAYETADQLAAINE
jgi:hypothetical protein